MGRRRRTRPRPWCTRCALDLKGVDEHLLRSAGLSGMPQEFTLSAWAKPGGGAAVEYLCEIGDGTVDNRLRVMRRGDLSPARLGVRLKLSGTEIICNTQVGGGFLADSWYHIAVTRTAAGLLTAYQDAGSAGSDTLAGTIPADKLSIGARPNESEPFTGRIAHLVLLEGVHDVDWLKDHQAFALNQLPDCYLAINPCACTAVDSSADGDTIHDWTAGGQDMIATNTIAADIVADSP